MTTRAPFDSDARLYGPKGAEVRVRLVCEEPLANSRPVQINKPADAVKFWHKRVTKAAWYDPDKESVVVLCLDTKQYLKAWNLVSLGCLTQAQVHPREVLRVAIVAASFGIVLMHNHPAGDPRPSRSDELLTGELCRSAETLGVGMADHIIVGSPSRDPRRLGYYSFRDEGFDMTYGWFPPSRKSAQKMRDETVSA